MKYKVGDVITVKVSVVNIEPDGDLECCHVGCEKDYETDDTDTMFFGEDDIVGLVSSSKTDDSTEVKSYDECPYFKIKYTDHDIFGHDSYNIYCTKDGGERQVLSSQCQKCLEKNLRGVRYAEN